MQIKEKKPFYSLYFALFILILQAKEQSRLNDEQDNDCLCPVLLHGFMHQG